MRAQHCPDSLLPASAGSFLKLAHANGWDAHATVAIGPPDDGDLAVMSVAVWARRPLARQRTDRSVLGEYVRASWECPSDRSKPFGFHSAWYSPGIHGIDDKMNFTEAKAKISA